MTATSQNISSAAELDCTQGEIIFINLAAVKELTSLGTTKIYDMMKKSQFPKQVSLGTRTVRWVRSEVLEWNRQQVVRSRGL